MKWVHEPANPSSSSQAAPASSLHVSTCQRDNHRLMHPTAAATRALATGRPTSAANEAVSAMSCSSAIRVTLHLGCRLQCNLLDLNALAIAVCNNQATELTSRFTLDSSSNAVILDCRDEVRNVWQAFSVWTLQHQAWCTYCDDLALFCRHASPVEEKQVPLALTNGCHVIAVRLPGKYNGAMTMELWS
eukprot:3136839-Amphidinium_carterae.1